jgi:glycosyltransferase involved in cell wall biosynthesis
MPERGEAGPSPGGAPRRIALVTNEILGLVRNGGAGTANTFLCFALARLGHQVEVLVTPVGSGKGLDPIWAEQYEQLGIRIRLLDDVPTRIIPDKFAGTCAVTEQLRQARPDVVVVHDWAGPAYAALRSRHLGLDFTDTLFVVYCHATHGWVYDAHRQVQRWYPAFELEALEQASVELADVVVSPSAYLLDWMRSRGWQLPRSVVAPYFTRSFVEGRRVESIPRSGRLKRIVFFGRLEERKGLAPFIAALNALDSRLLAGVELVFVGKETQLWTVKRVKNELSNVVKRRAAAIRFETELDQPEALALVKQQGTLAVMPSLVDNSPNVIYECLEHGIPFLAGSPGGGPELVAEEDRARTFVEPTTEGIRRGLARFLTAPETIRPARPAFDQAEALSTWGELVASAPASPAPPRPGPGCVSAIVFRRRGTRQLDRSLQALRNQSRPPDEIVVVAAPDSGLPEGAGVTIAVDSGPSAFRRAGLLASRGDLVVLVDDGDVLDADCLETLVRASASSGADVVTCGMRRTVGKTEETYLFLGEPRALGLFANYYGLLGLFRRAALERLGEVPDTQGDGDWLLLASLSIGGAHIESVPKSLGRTVRTPGGAATDPIGSGAALEVVRAFERGNSSHIGALPQIAASLVAGAPVEWAGARAPDSPSFRERIRWVWEREGAKGIARRGALRAVRVLRGGSRARTRRAARLTN